MPLRKRLCQEAKHSSHRVASSGVWVTDDALSDAFNRFLKFSNGAKRYGSNVPGPLEAQKRLAKRRMMGLARVGAAPPVDPAALFGIGGPKMGKVFWQPPSNQHEAVRGSDQHKEDGTQRQEDSWLDRMFGGTASSRTEVTYPPPVGTVTVHLSAEDGGDQLVHEWRTLHARFRNANVEAMGILVKEAIDNGLDNAEVCKKAFGYIIRKKHISWEAIMDFMLDPTLNVAESRHATHLLSKLSKRMLSLQEFTAAKKLIEACLRLGLVAEDEFSDLISAAFKCVENVTESTIGIDKTVGSEDSAESLIHTIWRGFNACRIRSTPAHIAELILIHMPRSRSLAELRFELLQHAYPVSKPAKDSDRMATCLAAWATETWLSPEAKMNASLLVDVLEDLRPTNISSKSLVRATELLLDNAMSAASDIAATQRRNLLIEGWLICLRKALAMRVWIPVLEKITAMTDISPMELPSFFAGVPRKHFVCEALLQWWLPKLPKYRRVDSLRAMSLSYKDQVEALETDGLENAEVMYQALSDFRTLHQESRSEYETDMFAFLLITLHRLKLQTIINQELILGLCEQLYGAKAVAQVCKQAREAGVYIFSHPVADLINRIAVDQPRVALWLYKARQCRHLDLPKVLTSMINDGVHSVEIFQILADPMDGQYYVNNKDRVNPKQVFTQARAELIYLCAEAFSRQRQSSPRVRFRNVYLCYRYLCAREMPIPSAISRALVRAGITNYLQAGLAVGKTQVTWVLRVVEKVEGAETARVLDALINAWITSVYAAWNKRGLNRRAPGWGDKSQGLVRKGNGLVKGKLPVQWLIDHGRIPRRIRSYIDSENWHHPNPDDVLRRVLSESRRHGARVSRTKDGLNLVDQRALAMGQDAIDASIHDGAPKIGFHNMDSNLDSRHGSGCQVEGSLPLNQHDKSIETQWQELEGHAIYQPG